MKNQPRIYLLKMNSPSHKVSRLWTGKSLHALRHCSVKQIGSALAEMQKSIADLQKNISTLRQATAQWAGVSAKNVGRP